MKQRKTFFRLTMAQNNHVVGLVVATYENYEDAITAKRQLEMQSNYRKKYMIEKCVYVVKK